MKKLLSFIIILTMICTIFTGMQITSHALSNHGSCGENVTYNFNSSTGVLTISGSGNMKYYDYNGSPFYNQTIIKTVIINNGVTSIGDSVFYGCSGIKEITIPNSITKISSCALSNCSSLTSIDIPNSVKIIGQAAFQGCSGLTKITVPNSVTTIGESAFYRCGGLSNLYVSDGNEKYDSRGNCNAIIETETNTLIAGCKNTVIPTSVTSIGNYAFYGSVGLTSLVIPESVISIGVAAFNSCTGLKELTMPASAKIFNTWSVFAKCDNIEKITLTKGTGLMQLYAPTTGNTDTYYQNTPWYISRESLQELKIEDGIVNISPNAFRGCCGLISVTIPKSITSIGDYAFNDCSSLTSIDIPDSVEKIGRAAFQGCSRLTRITIPSSVTTIAESTFNDCSSLVSVIIPNSVKSIGDEAFKNCSSLDKVVIPDSVENIGNRVLQNCNNLKELTIPNIENATEIYTSWSDLGFPTHYGTYRDLVAERLNVFCTPNDWVRQYLFYKTKSISFNGLVYNKIEIDADKIVANAFRGNVDIQALTLSVGVKQIERSAFNDCSNLKTITIPYHIVSYTHNDQLWESDMAIDQIDSQFSCFINSPIEKLIFNDKPTELTDKFNCLYKYATLKEFDVPDSVTYIGEGTFKDCNNLTSVTIPKSVTRIEYNAFSGCTNVTIKGYKGSFAETYCKQTGIPFKVIADVTTSKVGGFKCMARTSRAQTITWSNVKSATGYQVQISTKDGKKWSSYATLGAGVIKYTFKNLAAGNNYKFRVRYFVKDGNGKVTYSAWSNTLNSPTLPSSISLTKLSAGRKSFTAQWKKASITGYQVQYSTNAKFSKVTTKTMKGASKVSLTVKNLKGGTKYYVRIRTYKTIGGKNYFSTWSAAKAVTTKK